MQQRLSLIFTRCIVRSFSTKTPYTKPPISPKQNESIQRNQEILSSYMVPGKLKKFFKTRPTRDRNTKEEERISSSTAFPTTRARKVAEQAFGEPPSIAQQQTAQRIERAILKMNASEPLPSRLVTPEYIRVVGVKVLSNLQKCHVYWRPCSDGKTATQSQEALKLYQPVLTRLIQRHAHMRRPIAIKYVQDRNGEELESIFEQLGQEHQENRKQR